MADKTQKTLKPKVEGESDKGGSNAIALYKSFETELAARHDEFSHILSPHITPERFRTTALIAVKNEPKLLLCTRRSLHAAITEAAEDGLLPDGREGTITIYTNKDNTMDAQWNPMIFGIRKRARELCGIIIDAQVVYENDAFERDQGDDPRIIHRPAPLGKPRGAPVGVYAIFKQGQEILHREVMDAGEVDQVKSCVRSPEKSLMWSKFWTEAWRKTVIRRGIKTVPSIPELERIVRRGEMAEVEIGPPARLAVVSSIPSAPPTPQRAPKKDVKAEDIVEAGEADVVTDEIADMEPAGEQAASVPQADAEKAKDKVGNGKGGAASAMDAFRAALKAAETSSALNAVWALFEKKLAPSELGEASTAFEQRFAELSVQP